MNRVLVVIYVDHKSYTQREYREFVFESKEGFILEELVMKSINFLGVLVVLWSIGSAIAAPQWQPRAPAPGVFAAPPAPPPDLVVRF